MFDAGDHIQLDERLTFCSHQLAAGSLFPTRRTSDTHTGSVWQSSYRSSESSLGKVVPEALMHAAL
jgi:hypothetical protein